MSLASTNRTQVGEPGKSPSALQKDNRQIAALSGLGIVLVVIGHTQGTTPEQAIELISTDSPYRAWTQLIAWIYTFHMPLFMAISGYLFGHVSLRRGKISYGGFIAGKARRLLAPYVFISSLAFLPKAALASYANRPLRASWFDYVHNLVVPWDNVIVFFWFLPTLMLCFLVAPGLPRVAKSRALVMILVICSIAAWIVFPHVNRLGYLAILNIGGALHNFVFFLAGFLMRNQPPSPNRHALAWALGALGVSVFVFLLMGSLPIVQLLLAFLGITFSYAVVRATHLNRLIRLLAFVGDYSYQIYLFSWFPMVFIRVTLREMLSLNIWMVIVLSAVLGLLVPIVTTNLLDRFVPTRARFLYGH